MRSNDRNGTVICQRCLAANSLELEYCGRCGTRLMLVVEPPALRFEEDALGGDYEEHLLERVSALENKLVRLWEKLEQVVDYLSRNVRTSYFDHILLETLLSELGDSRVVSRRRIEELWHERFERDAAAMAETSRREELRTRVTARYRGGERAVFAGLVADGFDLIEKGRETQGLRQLERAAALSPENGPLNSFLGEHFFRARKNTLARDYLSRALDAEPGNPRACLLLGLLCGDQGEAARARDLLRQSVSGGRHTFAAHYALGRLHAAEADWKGALPEFRLALAARKCPEAHYMLGLVCYQLGRQRTALRHLRSALDMDDSYAEALYLLGLVHLRLGEPEEAARAFQASRAARGEAAAGQKPGTRRRKPVRPEDLPPPSLFAETRGGRRRLVTGGEARVAAALREDALATPAV